MQFTNMHNYTQYTQIYRFLFNRLTLSINLNEDRPPPEVKSKISFDKFCVRADRAIDPSNNTILAFTF
jgi:hypothetical protein